MTAPVKTYSHCTIHLQLQTTVSSATLTLLSTLLLLIYVHPSFYFSPYMCYSSSTN